MDQRPLGRTGLQTTPLGFGAAPAAILKTEQEQAAKMINELLDSGINLIDTAAGYPGSEVFLGNYLSHRRSDYVLVSKCGRSDEEITAPDWSPELIAQSIDRSLRRLKTDRLDVMLLHSCDLDTLKKGDALRALVDARNKGKIRFAGYSGDNDAAARAAEHPDIAVIETSISIADQVNIDWVLPKARASNIGVLAKRPIANAAWKEINQQVGFYQSYAKGYTDRLQQMQLNPRDLGFDGDPAQAWPELALRFTLSQPGVHCAIIGTTNPDNARRNRQHVDNGPLPLQTIEKIRQAFRSANPDGSWLGLT
jgi:aryl-alcohol dehydrogenase-like predicted oxidoreductase